jgi:hypothetical protein
VGGGIFAEGAGSSLSLQQSRVLSNRTNTDGASNSGGGLFLGLGSSAAITDSWVVANTSDHGGGLFLNQTASVNVLRTGITGNTASAFGGGVKVQWGSSLLLIASTVSGNSAGAEGGGLHVTFIAGTPEPTATLSYTTVSDNDAPQGGGVYDTGGAPTSLSSSIVAGNRRGGSPAALGADCRGAVANGGSNLVGAGTGCPAAGNTTVAPTQVFTSVLGPLADNGGPSPTHALLGAAAVDVPGLSCSSLTTRRDQRGVNRPRDGDGDGVSRCDRGAFER